jgi:hypothetical protein
VCAKYKRIIKIKNIIFCQTHLCILVVILRSGFVLETSKNKYLSEVNKLKMYVTYDGKD